MYNHCEVFQQQQPKSGGNHTKVKPEFDPLLDIMLENETPVIIYIAAVSYLIRTPRRQPSQ